jgi:ABC-2 type transport system ATP-binding protein
MLCTLVKPTSGTATVAGFDVNTQRDSVRRNIGLVFQDTTLDTYLTAEQNMRLHAELYGVQRHQVEPRMRQVLEMVGLWERRRSAVATFSGGMKRRLEIARGLMHSPRVLFLDEPTVGLDPQTRSSIWTYIRELKGAEDITIFLTTHYMDEAEYLADRIAVLSAGRVVAEGTPRTLGGRDHMATAISFTLPDGLAARDLPEGLRPLAGQGPGGTTLLHSESPLVHLQMLGNWALSRGFDLPDLGVHRPTLEEVYLSLTGPASAKDQR